MAKEVAAFIKLQINGPLSGHGTYLHRDGASHQPGNQINGKEPEKE